MLRDHLARLLDHLEWADQQALEALRGVYAPPPDALRRFAHVLAAERIWLARLRGEETAGLEVWPALDLEASARLARYNVAALRSVLGRLTDADLCAEIPYRTTSGALYRNTPLDILQHVALHGAYHRGQVALVLRGAAETPLPTDYITYARERG